MAAIREAQPGHRLQIDVKFIAPLAGSTKKHHQFTAIDDCTATAIRFVDYVLDFEVHSIQTDNGAEFQSRFHCHVADRGIDYVYIRPNTLRLNGKVERSHRIDEEEFYPLLDGEVIDDANLFDLGLKQWEDYYNFDRPHGALQGQTPSERLRHKTDRPV